MTSGFIAEPTNSLKRKYPVQGRCWTGFSTDREQDGLLGSLPWWPFVDWGKDFAFGMPPEDADGGIFSHHTSVH